MTSYIFKKKDWLKKKTENDDDYENRLWNLISIKNIKDRFNLECFTDLLDNNCDIYSAIAKSCNADEQFSYNLKDDLHDDVEVTMSLRRGNFFEHITPILDKTRNCLVGKIQYMPVAEWITNDDKKDDPESCRREKYGLLKFKNPTKNILIHYSYSFPDGNDFTTAHPLLKFSNNDTSNNQIIKEYIINLVKNEMYSLKYIYLKKDLNWDLDAFIKNLPDYNLYNITTNLWLTDFLYKDYENDKYTDELNIKETPNFSKKFDVEEWILNK